MSDIEIKNGIINCLKEVVGKESIYNLDEIDNTTSLYTVGINSLNVIKIIMMLEDTFNISFEDEDIAMKNWKNIDTIIEIIRKRLD